MDPRRAIAQRVLERHRARVLSLAGLAGLSLPVVAACSSGKAEPGAGLLVAPMQPIPTVASATNADAGGDASLVYRPFPREPTAPRGSCSREVTCTAEAQEKPDWPFAPPYGMCATDGDQGGVFSERESRKAHGEDGPCCYVSYKCDSAASGRPKHPTPVSVRGRRLEGGPSVATGGLEAMLEAEHFSVLAFRALARDLALHGAPAELVTAAFDAAEDEAAHVVAARRLMELGGENAQLDERGATLPPPATFDELVRAAFVEGCVGEGAVALQLEVAAALRGATEEASLLRAIAQDEARHADLGFRTLRWALEARPAAAGEALRAAVDGAADAGAPTEDVFLGAEEAGELASAWLALVLPMGAALAARDQCSSAFAASR